MFVEPTYSPQLEDAGWIEVICGCMFSGKTEELIRRLNRAVIADQKVEIFKPGIDNRYHDEDVVSHNKRAIRSTPVSFSSQILLQAADCDVVGIDEAQFFDDELPNVCNALANKGKRVIVAGLDMDSEGRPFGPMPYLLAIAEFVTKLHAICAISGGLGSFSYRKNGGKEQVMLGQTDKYEPRNRKYFYKNEK